jgi:hypothetical protein
MDYIVDFLKWLFYFSCSLQGFLIALAIGFIVTLFIRYLAFHLTKVAITHDVFDKETMSNIVYMLSHHDFNLKTIIRLIISSLPIINIIAVVSYIILICQIIHALFIAENEQ